MDGGKKLKRALPKYDDTTVAMVMAGYPMPITMEERREVIYRLRLKGMEINDIAAFLRVKPDLVRTDIDRYDRREVTTPGLPQGMTPLPALAISVADDARSLRDDDPKVIAWRLDGLSRGDLISYAMTALAMIPADVDAAEALSWTDVFAEAS